MGQLGVGRMLGRRLMLLSYTRDRAEQRGIRGLRDRGDFRRRVFRLVPRVCTLPGLHMTDALGSRKLIRQ